MKFVATALFVVAVTVHAATKDQYSSWNECLAEYNTTNDELHELYNKDDPKFHCFVSCRYEKEGILKNGELNKGAMGKALLSFTSKISEEEFNKMYDSCIAEVKDVTDMCDITNHLSLCIFHELAKAGVL